MSKEKSMHIRRKPGSVAADVTIYLILTLLALACFLPMLYVLAVSLSSNVAASAGRVTFWPVDFTLESYKYVANREAFWRSLLIALERVAIGVPVNLLLTVLAAYPLSKESSRFKARTFYAWFFFLTMIINGGLIPQYMVVKETGLLGTIWALILPGAVPVFNVVLMLNFFRQTPIELEEAAVVDGAGQWRILFQIFLPVSKASLATVTLFSIVNHWNSWFDGIIFMKNTTQYPLQSYLHTVVVQKDLSLSATTDWQVLSSVSEKTVKCAQIFLAAVPIMLIYPFLQRYFVKGLVIGSVKG